MAAGKRTACGALAVLLSFGGTITAKAESWLKTGSSTSIPYGHHAYCKSRPSDCGAMRAAAPEALTSARLSTLKSVNASINRSIEAKSDQSLYGKTEVWAYPVKQGDCEDYALAKRARLQRLGFHPANLLLAMAKRPNGEAHVVVVVRTNKGDLVLDNLTDQVQPVSRTRLRFLKIQNARNAADWVRVAGITHTPV